MRAVARHGARTLPDSQRAERTEILKRPGRAREALAPPVITDRGCVVAWLNDPVARQGTLPDFGMIT